ncbi:M56 family metallopeptidase [Shewanella livingstonensis]|uniref:Protein TonB n=1 Tax=Shewanella livingstonensis TaxID=150120 RepID=A0A3G8LYF9_9GAMM|nr:M56 family metallopeptidase [Shewanella livingstonensis]AZG74793.1 M56 family peptidase [Shewanella livingstonensis]
MINWFMEQTISLSVVCLALLVMHRLLLSKFGAHYTYFMWISVPLLIFADLLQMILPHHFSWFGSNNAASIIQQYYVFASDTAALSSGLFAQLYLPYLYGAVITLLVANIIMEYGYLQRLIQRGRQLDIPSVKLNVLVHPDIESPMLAGFIAPSILVPTSFTLLDESQQQAIIQHEVYHYQRGDLWANALAYGLTVLFWFNPLMWLSYRRFRQDQELSCDAQVTASMKALAKIAYSRTLLAYSQHAPLSMLHTHYGDKTILKERILQMKKQHGKSTLALIGMTFAIGVSAFMFNQQVFAGNNLNVENKTDSMAMPVIRIEPSYPIDAAKEGLNGYVQMSFDISPNGSVNNVRVTKSSPKQVFDASAVEALEQWKYQPSATGFKDLQVQLDYVIHQPEKSVERITVK